MKFFKAASIFLFILCQQKLCMAFFDPLILGTTLLSIGAIIGGFLTETEAPVREVPTGTSSLAALHQKLDREVLGRLDYISRTLDELPNNLGYRDKKSKLSELFENVNSLFLQSAEEKRSRSRPIGNPSIRHIWEDKLSELDHDYHKILEVLTGKLAVPWLVRDFRQDLMQYETICNTAIAHIQYLNLLLNQMKIMASQYLIASNNILDILYGFESSHDDRIHLKNRMLSEQRNAAIQFKQYMENASRDIHPCGNTDQVTPFDEMKISSVYFSFEDPENWIPFNKEQFQSKTCKDHARKNNQMIDYDHLGCTDPCVQTGSDRRISDCKRHGREGQKSLVCVNPYYTNSDVRYQSIALERDVDTLFYCDKPGWIENEKDETYICNCERDYYYIDSQTFQADDDKIIVAAHLYINTVRLTINGKRKLREVLGIRYEQARLLDNGIIDNTTRQWSDEKQIGSYEGSLKRLSLNGPKSFLLDEFELRDGHALTGLQLDIRDNSIVMLTGEGKSFDFTTGRFTGRSNRVEPDNQRPTKHSVDNDWPYKYSNTVVYRGVKCFDRNVISYKKVYSYLFCVNKNIKLNWSV